MVWLNRLVANLIAPLPLAALAVCLAGLLWWAGRRRLAACLWSATAVAFFLAAWMPFAERLLAPLENQHPPQPQIAADTDARAIVVLSSGWHENRPAYPVTARFDDSGLMRLVEGVRLYHALEGATLLLNDLSAHPETAGYSSLAQALGVAASDIRHIRGHNTRAEAASAQQELDHGEMFLLVTSASHMPRSVHYFQNKGLDPIPVSTRYKTGVTARDKLSYWVPSASALRATELAVYEYLGLVAAKLQR